MNTADHSEEVLTRPVRNCGEAGRAPARSKCLGAPFAVPDLIDSDVSELEPCCETVRKTAARSAMPLGSVLVGAALPPGVECRLLARGRTTGIVILEVAVKVKNLMGVIGGILINAPAVVVLAVIVPEAVRGAVVCVAAGRERIEAEVVPQRVLIVALDLQVEGATELLGSRPTCPFAPACCIAHALGAGVRIRPTPANMAV